MHNIKLIQDTISVIQQFCRCTISLYNIDFVITRIYDNCSYVCIGSFPIEYMHEYFTLVGSPNPRAIEAIEIAQTKCISLGYL